MIFHFCSVVCRNHDSVFLPSPKRMKHREFQSKLWEKKYIGRFFRAKEKYVDGYYGNCKGYSCQRLASQLLCYQLLL